MLAPICRSFLLRSPALTQIHDRLAQIGLSLLAVDSFAHFGTSEWLLTILLPQLNLTKPSVNACAITLGAVYALRSNATRSPGLETIASTSYIAALRMVRKDLERQPDESLPAIMACLLLAVRETVVEQVRNAVVHLRAAYKMLEARKYKRSQCSTVYPGQVFSADHAPLNSSDDHDLIFQAFDLQISVHALSYPPSSYLRQACPSDGMGFDLTTSRISLMDIQKSCFTWTASVLSFKYARPPHHRDLLIEHGRQVAYLHLWLQRFESRVLPLYECSQDAPARTLSALKHALLLRMSCTFTLIHVSTIIDPYETSYDSYAPYFEQTVLDAERFLSIPSVRRKCPGMPSDDRCKSLLGPGIIPPLFMTAEKYRNSSWRRRALACLHRSGQELLFNGRREAAIARRLLQYEETLSKNQPVMPQNLDRSVLQVDDRSRNDDLPSRQTLVEIPASARLNGCRLKQEDGPRHADKVTVAFYRCRDVERMLDCACNDGDYESSFRKRCHWEVWEEELQY